MFRLILTVSLMLPLMAYAEEPAESAEAVAASKTVAADANDDQGTAPGQPKTLSGMSILGNEEAPKSLVIIPWKSSELGEQVEFSDALDARAKPVDKEVFLRQLDFHAIRAGEQDSR